MTWTRDTAGGRAPWTIWVWPSYGLPWTDVHVEGTSASVRPRGIDAYRNPAAFEAADPAIRLDVSGGATIEYVPVEPRYNVQAMAIHVPAGASLGLTMNVSGADPGGTITTLDERDLIARNGVGAALVWRDSGWADRFSSSPCFRAGRSDADMVAFDVTPECLAAVP